MLFSVIVSTYNRLNLLKGSLESIWQQDITDFETIVVNDGSSDGTHEYLTDAASNGRIKYCFQSNQGLAASRGEGLRHAEGVYVAFTDDDCVVPHDWLRKISVHLDHPDVAGVGGSCATGDHSNWYAEANDMMQNYFKNVVNRMYGSVPFLTGNNIAYKRTVLERVGGPDKRFRMGAEDRDLVFRVFSTGGTLVYDPAIEVLHYNDANFPGFLRHQYQFGRGSYTYYTAVSATGNRPAALPLRTYAGMFLFPWGTCSPPKALMLVVLMILAQTAVVCGFIAEALQCTTHPHSATPS